MLITSCILPNSTYGRFDSNSCEKPKIIGVVLYVHTKPYIQLIWCKFLRDTHLHAQKAHSKSRQQKTVAVCCHFLATSHITQQRWEKRSVWITNCGILRRARLWPIFIFKRRITGTRKRLSRPESSPRIRWSRSPLQRSWSARDFVLPAWKVTAAVQGEKGKEEGREEAEK